MVASILNSATVDNSDALATEFNSALPFRHIVIDDFFDPDFCRQLLEEFPPFSNERAMNENGEIGKKAVNQKIFNLGPSYRKLDEVIKSPAFLGFLERVAGIDNLLYDPHYFGGGTHQNLEGQDLDPHVDFTFHPVLKAHRRINFILYLNREWHGEWGGNIEIHKDPRLPPDQDDIRSFEPLFNRVIIFETNNISWHGFPRISLPADRKDMSRRSVALYFYTEDREEKIKPHSTIYVERHLPARYQVGMRLSADDLEEIKILLARRDQHLKRLYNNISHLMGEVDGVRQQLARATAWIDAEKAKEPQKESQKIDGAKDDDPERQALLHRIHDLENSTSWKVTAPLRSISRLFRGG